MPLTKILSVAYFGLDALPVEVEVDAKPQEPETHMVMVGLPDMAVRESKDRVQAAIYNSGLKLNNFRCTINLAPANLKKEGALYDLPIALGILSSLKVLQKQHFLEDYLIVGELGLGGTTRPVRGILAAALLAKHLGKKGIILPEENAKEASYIPDLKVIGIKSIKDVICFSESPDKIKTVSPPSIEQQLVNLLPLVDFKDIKGQLHVKRAIEIAAAGGHNVVLSGPPGTGKSMIAKATLGIMPTLSIDEALEITKIHSLAGLLPQDISLIKQRPFRSPHHTVSYAGLVGGGSTPRPGEISLAHNGILFLDELPEFSRTSLEVLRQPLEDRKVTISRAIGHFTFPTNFMLLAAMNPCPCGNLGHPTKPCNDSSLQISRYRNKISAPLWDRIDMHIEVPALSYSDLSKKENAESSSVIQKRVSHARYKQQNRYQAQRTNASMTTQELKTFAPLDTACEKLLQHAVDVMGISARACDRIRRVAMTIADLEGAKNICDEHIMEAMTFRNQLVQSPVLQM